MKGNDRTTIIVALIGGVFVLLAAVIGLFNPLATRLADRLLSEPTPTVAPTATFTSLPPPSATPVPAATNTRPLPTATAVATRLPTFAVPRDNSVQFILANNDTAPSSFFIDGSFVTDIGSGAVLVFDAPRDTHQLESCPADMNPIADAAECDSVRYDIGEDPFDWTIDGDAKPAGDVTLVLMNVSTTPVNIYLDGILLRSLEPHQYWITTTPPGKHTFQNCPDDMTPDETDSTCIDPIEQSLGAPVELWKVGD